MQAPPTHRLRFRWSWRPHQLRVLRTVERHLQDSRLHIVAAPGAGKTTLGLEVFRRLGRPALALAPTLTIRDQWLRRLLDFLPEGASSTDHAWLAEWTSTDLTRPAFFTVSTYQAVLAGTRRFGLTQPDPEDADTAPPSAPSPEAVASLTETLRRSGVGTLILDEAHHLRREWWRALEAIAAALDEPTLLSLTATPPYDATGHEWRRYEELCGPIDDEISAPELVKAGTLCPHQDFVHAVAPLEHEAEAVDAHERAVRALLDDLIESAAFQGEIDAHPWVSSPQPDPETVLERPGVAVAILAYLRATGGGVPPPLLELLALEPGDVPSLDRERWQVLLREYLHGSTFVADEAHRRELARRLREEGLLWRRTLRISRSRAAERLLALSASKVRGCVDVHRHEREVRGRALRQVVLVDFIRDEGLDAAPASASSDLGALPVFDALVAASPRGEFEDVLLVSGRLTLIHASRGDALMRALPVAAPVRCTELPSRPGWLRVDGVATGPLVTACTTLLELEEVRTIVGTRSLLGEGWDAPVVNSIVLASFVGAFVGTNQMRGRAIRRDPADPDKVASVWHLVAVSPGSPTGVLDLDQLTRRFDTFVGLDPESGAIESGYERLRLPPLAGPSDLAPFNRASFDRLRRLDAVATGWRSAIETSGPGQVVPTVRFRAPPTLAPHHVRTTLRYVLLETAGAAMLGLGEAVRSAAFGGARSLGTALLVGVALPMLALAPRLVRSVGLATRHLPLDGSVRQIGQALLEALVELGLLEGEGLAVRSERLQRGGVHVSLAGGTFYDQSLFADAIAEILGPVTNPRYLITRRGGRGRRARMDHHAVPHVLGTRRERAEALHRAWLRRVGDGDLVYTRREGGRAVLLAARARAFANQFLDPAERLDRWQ